ncbi:MAG: lactate utilization protein [Eubacterium sp.]|nr:lactate utilization protein [Eubacterium sp.]
MIDTNIRTENVEPGSEYLQGAIKQFRRNGFTVSYFEQGRDAAEYLCGKIQGKTVGFGDSATLAALQLAERLREKNRVIDPGPYSGEDFYRVAREAMNTDIFLLSVNAASASGELVNIDSSGNRVGGSLFGHEKVYFVFSADKIEPSLERAVWRARNIAAPQNARRFGFRTPCAIKGDKCYNCSSPDRICNVLAIHMRKEKHMEEELVIIGENVLQHREDSF